VGWKALAKSSGSVAGGTEVTLLLLRGQHRCRVRWSAGLPQKAAALAWLWGWQVFGWDKLVRGNRIGLVVGGWKEGTAAK
jgi:hypothetical protein